MIQTGLSDKYAKLIANIYIGKVKDQSNTSKEVMMIALTKKGQNSRSKIENSAAKLAKEQKINPVVQFMNLN